MKNSAQERKKNNGCFFAQRTLDAQPLMLSRGRKIQTSLSKRIASGIWSSRFYFLFLATLCWLEFEPHPRTRPNAKGQISNAWVLKHTKKQSEQNKLVMKFWWWSAFAKVNFAQHVTLLQFVMKRTVMLCGCRNKQQHSQSKHWIYADLLYFCIVRKK